MCLTVRRHMHYVICVWVFSDSVWNEESMAWEFAEIPRFCKAGEAQGYTRKETDTQGRYFPRWGQSFRSLLYSLCILVDYQYLKDKNQASCSCSAQSARGSAQHRLSMLTTEWPVEPDTPNQARRSLSLKGWLNASSRFTRPYGGKWRYWSWTSKNISHRCHSWVQWEASILKLLLQPQPHRRSMTKSLFLAPF